MRIYPNPATSELHFELNHQLDEMVVIELRDIMGKSHHYEQLQPTSGLSVVLLDVSALKRGVYFYTLTADNDFITGKFIME